MREVGDLHYYSNIFYSENNGAHGHFNGSLDFFLSRDSDQKMRLSERSMITLKAER